LRCGHAPRPRFACPIMPPKETAAQVLMRVFAGLRSEEGQERVDAYVVDLCERLRASGALHSRPDGDVSSPDVARPAGTCMPLARATREARHAAWFLVRAAARPANTARGQRHMRASTSLRWRPMWGWSASEPAT